MRPGDFRTCYRVGHGCGTEMCIGVSADGRTFVMGCFEGGTVAFYEKEEGVTADIADVPAPKKRAAVPVQMRRQGE